MITWTIDPAALLSDIEKRLSFGLLLWSIRPVAELRALAASDDAKDKQIAAQCREIDQLKHALKAALAAAGPNPPTPKN